MPLTVHESEIMNSLIYALKNCDVPIRAILYDFLCLFEAGTNLHARHKNGLQLVEFMHRQALQANDIPSESVQARNHFLWWLDSLSSRLESYSKKGSCYDYSLSQEALFSRQLYTDIRTNFTSLHYHNITQLILDNWEHLSNWTGTYRLLASLTCIQSDWDNSDDTKDELAQIIYDTVVEWLID